MRNEAGSASAHVKRNRFFDCVCTVHTIPYLKLYQYSILGENSRHFKHYAGTGKVDDDGGDRK